MTPAEAAETRELKDMLHDAAGHLSPTHVAALFAHPLLRSSWSPCGWAGISAGVALPGSQTPRAPWPGPTPKPCRVTPAACRSARTTRI